jgi:hypothetical protein
MYYHVTPTENVPLIMSEGLIPQQGPRSQRMGADSGIFLFKNMGDVDNALMNWLGDEYEEDEPLTLLGVELPPDAEVAPEVVGWEVNVLSHIPPQYIQILSEDI